MRSRARRFINGLMRDSSPNRMNCACGKRLQAWLAPRSTARGAKSPPIASIAILRVLVTLKPATFACWLYGAPSFSDSLDRFRVDNFAVPVISTSATDMMRLFQLAAIRALTIRSRFQRVVRPPLAASGSGNLGFRNCHNSCLMNKAGTRAPTLRLTIDVSSEFPRGRQGFPNQKPPA